MSINLFSHNFKTTFLYYFFNTFGIKNHNTAIKLTWLNCYIFYLLFLTFFLYFIQLDSNPFYFFMYFHIILTNICYFFFNIVYNFIFYNFTFNVNFSSLYLLLNIDDQRLVDTFFLTVNLKTNDFYSFFILDYISNIQLFLYSLIINYLNYPIFILFAVLFFFTSFFSLLALSYLGFYGVFILNLVSLSSL